MIFGRRRGFTAVPLLLVIISLFYGCGDSYPENPYRPGSADGEAQGYWEDVIASDPGYPENVYLTENIEYHPGPVGESRRQGTPEYYDADGYPLDSVKNGACGPPEGTPAEFSSEGDMTVLGNGGYGIWRFDPGWVIVDGPGDDFITFSNHNLLYGEPDGSWNELAHVYASEDGINWYASSKEAYAVNPNPGTANDGYLWSAVEDMHGNSHSWANFRTGIAAEVLSGATGSYETLLDPSGAPVMISRYFKATDPYLGGDRFDLAAFVHVEPAGALDGQAWPADGKLRYLKIADEPEALDGQDWNPTWSTGARIMAAMGVNVEAAQ